MAESKLGEFRLSPLGDAVLLIELGADASEATAQRVHAVAEHLLRGTRCGRAGRSGGRVYRGPAL